MKITIRQAWANIVASYRSRKAVLEPDLCRWEFVVQMLCSAYLSWRWLGSSAKFQPWRPSYWLWLAQYSSLVELRTRASLAVQRYREQPPQACGVIPVICGKEQAREVHTGDGLFFIILPSGATDVHINEKTASVADEPSFEFPKEIDLKQ